jgi:hypothetical protein
MFFLLSHSKGTELSLTIPEPAKSPRHDGQLAAGKVTAKPKQNAKNPTKQYRWLI